MALNNTAKNVMLDALGSAAAYISLHSADPGSTGTSELTGGSYARKASGWSAASGGAKSTGAALDFNVPAGTVAYFGLWSALSAGTFYGGNPLSASEAYAAAGVYTLNSLSVTAT